MEWVKYHRAKTLLSASASPRLLITHLSLSSFFYSTDVMYEDSSRGKYNNLKSTKNCFPLPVLSISHGIFLWTPLFSSCTLLSISNPNIRQYESKRTNHHFMPWPWLQHWISQSQAAWHLHLPCELIPRAMFALVKVHCLVTSISPQTTNFPPPLAYLKSNSRRMTLAYVVKLKVLRSMSIW